MINGRQVLAIIRAETFDLARIERLESANYIGPMAVLSTEIGVISQAIEAGKVAHFVDSSSPSVSDADFVQAIVDSDHPDVFIEGDPYLVFINLDRFTASVPELEISLERLGAMAADRTLFAPGLGMGRMSAFQIFSQFDGLNSSAI